MPAPCFKALCLAKAGIHLRITATRQRTPRRGNSLNYTPCMQIRGLILVILQTVLLTAHEADNRKDDRFCNKINRNDCNS